jgi:lipid-A-disaccharide synthase
MLEAAALMSKRRPDVQFVVVVAPNRNPDEARAIISQGEYASSFKESLCLVHHETREALAAADAAAVASGTATLEAALLATPLVVVYKESALNWHTLGNLITTEHYGLANLIAGRRIVTELIQDDFTGKSLARELLGLLDADSNAAMRTELKSVAEKIGEPGASSRAARAILKFLSVPGVTRG